MAITLVGVTALVTTGGSTVTPNLTALTLAADDLLVVHVYRNGVLASVAGGAGENWTLFGPGTNFPAFWGWRRWGDGTDDTTPTFTLPNTSSSTSAVISVWRGVIATGDPYDDWEEGAEATSSTMTAPDATSAGTGRVVLRLYSSNDANAHGSPSEGDLLYGGADYDWTIEGFGALSASYTSGEGSGSVGTATMSQTTLGADTYDAFTIILTPTETLVTGSLAVTLADSTSAASGGVGASGSLAVATANATLVASGAVGASGSLAVTTENATGAAAGSTVTGSLAETTDDATSAADGEFIPNEIMGARVRLSTGSARTRHRAERTGATTSRVDTATVRRTDGG